MFLVFFLHYLFAAVLSPVIVGELKLKGSSACGEQKDYKTNYMKMRLFE